MTSTSFTLMMTLWWSLQRYQTTWFIEPCKRRKLRKHTLLFNFWNTDDWPRTLKTCLLPGDRIHKSVGGARRTYNVTVRVGENEEARDIMAEFLVVDVSGAYNAIVGCLFIHDVQWVVSTYHLTMLYVSNRGVITRLKGNQEMARSCYLTALKQKEE